LVTTLTKRGHQWDKKKYPNVSVSQQLFHIFLLPWQYLCL